MFSSRNGSKAMPEATHEQGDFNHPCVSIILPAYNAERTLGECVKSVTSQDFADFELIVIDDGSTDRTLDVLKGLTGVDRRIRCLAKENGGVSSARNEGLRLAHGEFVMFLDSDDILLPGALGALLRACTPATSLVVASYVTYRRIVGIRAFAKEWVWQQQTLFEDGARETLGCIDHLFGTPWAKLYRLASIREASLHFPDIPFGEDHQFNLRYLLATDGDVKVISNRVYGYTRGGLASSLKYYPNKAELALTTLDCFENECRVSNRFDDNDPFFETIPTSLLGGVLFHICVSLPRREAAPVCIKAIRTFNDYWFHDAGLDPVAYYDVWKKSVLLEVRFKRCVHVIRGLCGKAGRKG